MLLTLLILSLSQAVAMVLVEDPQKHLESLDKVLGSPVWETSFRTNDQGIYLKQYHECKIDCTNSGPFTGCSSSCQHMDVTGARTVASCDQESLKIYSDSGENLDLTREEFNKLNGNMARHFLVNFDEYVPGTQKLRVLSLVPTTYKLKVGTPEERAIPAYHLNGKFRLAQYPEYEIDFLITFGKGLPAVAQILRLRVLEQSWFRLLDSKRESL